MASRVKRAQRPEGEIFPLSAAGAGDIGVIVRVGSESDLESLSRTELERRLLEMGFVEGARIKVLHEGFIGRDPIAVQLDDMRVALRRREAADVMVQSLSSDQADLA
jgi:ferrous iron transport protein A